MRTSVLFVVWFLSTVSVALAGASQDRLIPQTVPMRDLPPGATIAGQVPGDGRPLTLQTALDEALARNPRLIALRRQYDAMLHRPAQALALAPPSFEAQIWQWPFNTLSARNTNMFMFTVGQALPGRGKRGLRAAVADKDAELSLAAIAVEARDVIDQVKRVYAELFLTRRETEILQANVDLLRQFADVSEAKYTTGGISQQDILKAVVELSRVHEDLVTLGARERLAQARLNTLLDRAPESPVGNIVEPREDGVLPAVAELQRLALDRQPELRAAQVEIARAEAVLAAERQESKPDFFVKGGYFLMPQMPDSWTAMVGITWPTAPWSRSGLDARVAEAGAAVETARARYAAGETAIRFAVHESHVRAEAAQERAALLRTSIVPQSDQTLAVSRVAYQADQGDFLTLIDNQRVLLDVQLAYYRALSDLEQARADLERAVGTDVLSPVTAGATSTAKELTQLMTTTLRTIATIVFLTAVSIGALAATVYTFRGRLADTPIVGGVVDRLGWRPEMDPPDASSWMPDPMPPAPEPAAIGSPRAEVQIDPRRQQLIGVRTAPAERRTLTKPIRAVGTVRYDETRLADVNVKVAGWIEELHVDYTGQFVEAGQPLFTIYSPDLLTTQQEYLLALESRAQLRESQIADARVYADRLVDAARQRLVLWDLPPDEIQSLEDRRETHRTMLFRAPVGGFVIEKRVVQGQYVSPGMSLYTVADLSAVWVEADLYEEEVPLVREGARATVTLDAYPEERFRGRVTYIYPYVEERTRTVRVRFAFPNPRGRLKPGMYANVALDVALGEGVVVPTNALLDSGDQQHVFVSEGDGYFEPRPVVVGRRRGETIQILEGLEGGELVATSATFFIDSESQLRAALQGFEPVPRAGEGGAARERLDITFRSQPDPPRSGNNAFEVAVLDPEGQPLTDAEVSVVFYMAPMPTMNMPAMQSDAPLTHQGSGIYRGEGEVTMAGRWDVTVLVSRGGQRLDSRTLTVVAR